MGIYSPSGTAFAKQHRFVDSASEWFSEVTLA
jgi:hypothetical protein